MRLLDRREAGYLPASFLLIALLAACGNEASPTPVASGGTLDCQLFQASVNPIFDQNLGGRTCSASGCHTVFGSAGGAFKIYPNAQPNTVEMQANYLSAKGMANLNEPSQSKLLLEPLAGAQSIVGSHTGGDIFASTADANYGVILGWISMQVAGPSACFP